LFPYHILFLYRHFALTTENSAFNLIDGLIFPKDKPPLLRPSLELATARLHCLAKYKLPLREEMELVRELLHEDDMLTPINLRNLMMLGNLGKLKED
jgi:hypothetical protein